MAKFIVVYYIFKKSDNNVDKYYLKCILMWGALYMVQTTEIGRGKIFLFFCNMIALTLIIIWLLKKAEA